MNIEILYRALKINYEPPNQDELIIDIKQEKESWRYEFYAVRDENGIPTLRPICAPFQTKVLPWIQHQYKDRLILRSLSTELSSDVSEMFVSELVFELYKVSDAYHEAQQTRSGYDYKQTIQGIPTCNIKGRIHPAIDIHNGTLYLGYRFLDEVNQKHEWMIDSDRTVHTPEKLLDNGLILRDKGIFGEPRWMDLSFLQQKKLNPFTLYNSIKHKAMNHIWFSNPLAYDVLTLWIMGTYMYPGFMSFPYIHLSGTPDSGKSTVQRFTAGLSFNGYFTESVKSASIFRYVEEMRATMCLDEQEFLGGGNNDVSGLEAVSILNSGYHKAGTATRQEQQTNAAGDKKLVTVSFSTYSPKMLSGIRGLDPTLATRSINIPMKPSTNAKYSRRPIDDTDPSWQLFRDQLYVWSLDSFPKISECHTNARDFSEIKIKNRMWQKFHPLISLALFFKELKPSTDIYSNLIKFIQQDQEPTVEYNDYLIDLCFKVLYRVMTKFPNTSNKYSFELVRSEAATMLGIRPPYDFKNPESAVYFLRDINKTYNTLGYKSLRLAGNYRGIKATVPQLKEEALARGIVIDSPLIKL